MPHIQDNQEPKNLLYETQFPARWSDMDAFGHVNNSIYLRYFECIRADWVTQLGYLVSVNLITEGPTIVDSYCQYLAPVVYPAELKLTLFGGTPGRSSFNLFYELRDSEDESKLYCIGSTRMVWINFDTGRSIPLPQKIRELLPLPE